ncbi:MAG: diguanylate cyclase [Pyrinomonadaceae bacterium]
MKTGVQTNAESRKTTLDNLAAGNGLAIVLIDENSSALSASNNNSSNNNSMCRILYNSEKFAPECEKFCGKAFERATEAGEIVGYKCYANLECLAVPMKKENKKMVAIVGRAFTKAEDYRRATTRAADGDWSEFPPDEFFENVLLTSSEENLKKLAKRVERLSETGKEDGETGISNSESQNLSQESESHILSQETAISEQSANDERQTDDEQRTTDNEQQPASGEQQASEPQTAEDKDQNANPQSATRNPQSAWRSLFGSLLELTYKQACLAVMQFVSGHYSLGDLAWLERRENRLETIYATGELKDRQIKLSVSADDENLLEALRNESPLEMRERQSADETLKPPQTIRLFPVAVGSEIGSALIVGDELEDDVTKRRIAKFCQSLASDLEILRLREQLARRGFVERAVERFNESLQTVDSEDFWSQLINVSAELMRAERTSLLVFDEKSNAFTAKAATGIRADFIKREAKNLGERVAKNVLIEGAAVAVEDVNKIGLRAAPEEWLYKSDSFISYPIAIGTRKIGVLNLTEKADGDIYSESDLELLDAIMPSLAVLIDRADLKNKAGEFEHLSVTDALTGLLNRRYLEERLTEEIKRSGRHGSPMSFMMIDVDEFKSYNDNFGHAEGDRALKLVGNALKETLRDEDVAARYGGEEFSILLPQTNSFEAATIAERVRERVEQTDFPNRQVTVSIGIASYSISLDSAEKLIEAADKALYAAKRQGRNNVQIYENLNDAEKD